MKPIACLLKTLVLASSLSIAVSGLAQETTTVLPSKSAVNNKTETVEKEPVIPGIVLSRPNGGYLGLTLENNNFKLSFYDSTKLPVTVDVARAAARWQTQYKVADERAVLNPTPDGLALTSSKFIRPPYVFRIYLSLLKEPGEGEEAAAEPYVIYFRQ